METTKPLLFIALSALYLAACSGAEPAGAGGSPSTSSSTASGDASSSVGAPGTGGAGIVGTSISQWVSCDGVTDDQPGVAAAFAAARHGAFTLIVDCPVRIHVGSDIRRAIYIDDGTTVVFTGAGKMTVDDVLMPAFVMADSKDITLTSWNLEYDASTPVDLGKAGYEDAGVVVPPSGSAPVAGAFNDKALTDWLAANRNVAFSSGGHSHWTGPTNASAVFFLTGDTSNVTVTKMHFYVPDSSSVERLIPMAFSLGLNYRANQPVTSSTPMTAQTAEIPHGLAFSDITIDGAYMGWQGSAYDATFDHVESFRYGDLEDANGDNIGGVGKWFAPPHLFYLSYDAAGDPALFNRNIHITNVTDHGVRIGLPRDKGGSDTISGYALSLKIGCHDCSVDGYTTSRPDGFLDVLPSDNLTLSNLTASYDSSFLNDVFPGWRFPSTGYTNVTISNVALTDLATSTVQHPLGNAAQPSNAGIVMSNVNVGLQKWSGTGSVLPTISGATNTISLTFQEAQSLTTSVKAEKASVGLTLAATPTTVHPGESVALGWTSTGGASCAPSGVWSGTVAANGSQALPFSTPGTYEVTLTCQNAIDSTSATIPIVVSN